MLSRAIEDLFPDLTLRSRVLVQAVSLARGHLGRADRVAKADALPSRFALARMFRGEHLPPLHELGKWIAVLTWLVTWEREQTSLFKQSLRDGWDPASAYRAVRSTSGMTWTALCRRGSGFLLVILKRKRGVSVT